MTRKTFWILFSIAAFFRLVLIAQAQLWYDENFTLILARLPFERMMQATAGDVHPPLWYVIEWVLFHVAPGLPVWGIRIPSFVFSLLAFAMFVRVCNALYIPPRVQVIASALMAVLPMQVWYAQEGRMYAMLEFLVLAALWTGLTRKWFVFFLASLAMLYTQNYGAFYLAVVCLVLVIMDFRSFVEIATAALVAGLLYSPWVFVIASQMSEISGRYWIVDASAGAVLKTIYQQFWSSSMLRSGLVGSYVVTFVALILGTVAVTRARRWQVLALAFMPFAIAWIISMLWQPVLLFRALIGTAPFLYLIVAWPWSRYDAVRLLDRRMIYAACFALPLGIMGLGGYYQNIGDMKGEAAVSPLLSAMDFIRAHWQSGDVLYYTDDGPMVNLMPYTADLPQYRMPDCDHMTLGSLSTVTRIAIGAQVASLDDVPHERAWVFAPRSPLHPQCYEQQIKPITPGSPLILVDSNDYMTSGVWLVSK